LYKIEVCMSAIVATNASFRFIFRYRF